MKKLKNTLRFKIEEVWYGFVRPIRLFIRKHIQRLHMLDMRSKQHGYDGGYIDPAEQVLYANFAILKNFVEREKPFEFNDLQIINGKVVGRDGDTDPDTPYFQEMYELYEWWTRTRKMDSDAVTELSSKVTYRMIETEDSDPKYGKYFQMKWEGPHKEWTDAETAFQKKEDEMLERLIKVRRHLWL